MTEIRPGGTGITVRNSGREVWLYDDANLTEIRAFASRGAGGAPGNFLTDIFAAHIESLSDADRVRSAPTSPEESLAAFGRFLVAAFG